MAESQRNGGMEVIVLIFGLSGSGKTTLAESLNKILNFTRLNGDELRKEYNDWDFSIAGRIRQATRIKVHSNKSKHCLIDIIAPLEEQRTIISPDYSIWMNTIHESEYKDTDELFEIPKKVDKIITSFDYDIDEIIKDIK